MTNVGFTKIYSPVDGVVVTRAIDPGATVVASFQAPVLFVIAQDLRKMRVLADVDEADVGKLHEKMEAEAVVDAFPGETFHGMVQQVRYSPNTVAGVVTYSAVVEVDNPEEKLRPGMTATVTIKTREAKGVLRVPNAALRFKPTPPPGPMAVPASPPPEPPLGKGQGRVHVLVNDKPGEEKDEARVVPIGVTDGLFTELTDRLAHRGHEGRHRRARREEEEGAVLMRARRLITLSRRVEGLRRRGRRRARAPRRRPRRSRRASSSRSSGRAARASRRS